MTSLTPLPQHTLTLVNNCKEQHRVPATPKLSQDHSAASAASKNTPLCGRRQQPSPAHDTIHTEQVFRHWKNTT